MKKRFLSVLLCLCMVLGLVPVTVWAATTSGHTHYLCGGDTCSGSGHEAESSKTTFATEIVQTGSTLKIGDNTWTATKGSNSNTFYILPAGTYYLGTDISPNYTIRIEKNVTLCLNGYKITATNGMDAIELASGSFTLTDCKTTGKITHASSKTGRGVYVKGGTFNMYGGSITGNTAQDFNGRGGGVYVTSGGGTFKMFGGSITGNKASYGGGVYMIGSNSKFTMTGGSITGNTASYDGGGVYVNSSKFTMSGGTIGGTNSGETNRATYGGGGVCVDNGTFNMTGGSITGNKATYGGGVEVYGGKFTMSASANGQNIPSITGNKADHGGGVYVTFNEEIKGTFNMTGGSITGNTANSKNYGGGGVYVNSSTFEMSSGSITGNNTSYGGGVYVDGGTFTMKSGSITGNTATSDGGGVYVAGTFTMIGGTIGGTETGEANTASNGGGVYVGGRGEFAMSGNASISGNGAKWGGGVCVGNGTFTMTDGSITGNNATINGGGVYLASTGRFTMSNGSITSNNAGGDGGGGVYVDGGTFHMSSGSITGNKTDGNGGGVYVYCGSFEMSADGQNIPSVSGNTAKNYGGGVYVYGGTFTMKSGSITGNTATSHGGGGVYVNGGSFTMESGSITGNKTIASGTGGGGVYVTGDKSTFTMNSGSITGNTAKNYGGGVGVGKSGTFNMTGGGITGNTATISGGGVYVTWDNGTFKMTGGSITGNNAEYGGGVRVNGTFTVSGSVNVTGNTKGGTKGTDGKFTDGTNNNVYLPEGKTITVGTGGLITGASIGVTTATKPAKDSPVQIATNATESADYTEIFTPDAGAMYTITKSGTSVYLALHVHTWTYALKEGTTDTITATCKNCEDNNGQDFVGGSVILKVSQDLTYDGTKKTASKWADEVSTDSPAFSDITYYEKSDNAWTQLSSAPINVGEYKAVLTATNADSSTATAFVTYSIEKANKEAPNGLTTEEDRYNTGKGKLIGTTADMEYNTSADTATGWKDCSDGSTEVAPGTYYVRYKETDNYYASAVSAALTVKAHTHSGGNATCKNKAVCDGCGQEYGELGNHNFTEVDGRYLVSAATCDSKAVYNKSCSVCGAKSDETFESGEFDYTNHIGGTYKKNQKEATCYAEGYTGDIYCSTCNHEIEKGTPIAKNDHNPASVWTTDETDHWKECQTVGCGNIIDKAHHSGGEATCVKKAICSVCKIEYGDVDATNHKHTEVRNAKEATCCEKGYTGDKWCTDCNTIIENGSEIPATGNHVDVDGKWESDGTNHWHTCYFGTKFDVTAHSGGEATCISKANCSVCEIEYGNVDASNHKHTEVRDVKEATCCEKGYTGDTWCTDCNTKVENGNEIPATGNHTDTDGKWESDGTNHWHTCYFGTQFDVTAHSGGKATCKNQAECSECGHSYGSFDASNHKGTTYLKNQKEATCYDEGYTGDTYCSDCNEKIADGQSIAKNAHNPASVWSTDEHDHWKECQTIGCGNVIDKAAHSGVEATCISKAVCEICKAQYGDIDATNHKHTEIRNAKPATEQEKGYTGDTWCTDCNKKIADGKETDLLSHSLKKVEAKAATTKENGNIEYFYCAGCGKYFADQDATKEITLAQTVLGKLKGNEESPKTGDDNMVAVWSLAAIFSLAVLGFTTVVSKKKRAK